MVYAALGVSGKYSVEENISEYEANIYSLLAK
jgi:hypothetical protein